MFKKIRALVLSGLMFLSLFIGNAYAQSGGTTQTPTFTVDTSQALVDFKAGAVALIAFVLVVFGVKKLISLYDGGK